VQTPGVMARLVVEAARAPRMDGPVRVETFDAAKPEGLPSEQELPLRKKRCGRPEALRAAPLASHSTARLLSGARGCRVFHEVLGHRLEGHRQRGETEGRHSPKK